MDQSIAQETDSPVRRSFGALDPRILSAGIVVGVAGLAGVARVVNPYSGHLPVCPFRALTGLSCPGCGATRAAHALMHGHVVEALHHNAVFVATILLLAWVWAAFTARAFFGVSEDSWAKPLLKMWRSWMRFIPAAVVLFFIVRNIPGWPVHLLSA